jgi:arylsulfatase
MPDQDGANSSKSNRVNRRNMLLAGTTLAAASALPSLAALETVQAQSGQQPNIIVIMGDDIGWSNIGVYNQGIMAGRTPNLDRMASEGMRFTDYYA